MATGRRPPAQTAYKRQADRGQRGEAAGVAAEDITLPMTRAARCLVTSRSPSRVPPRYATVTTLVQTPKPHDARR